VSSLDAEFFFISLPQLAASNRIVICTIHQPRSDIYDLFDRLMVLSEGHCVYYGEAKQLPRYLATAGYPCLETANPCDHVLNLVTIDRRSTEAEQQSRERFQILKDLHRRYRSENESMELWR
jgi:ATP-binding cassette subfamily G (WHITE) protein 8 (sterolin 2)